MRVVWLDFRVLNLFGDGTFLCKFDVMGECFDHRCVSWHSALVALLSLLSWVYSMSLFMSLFPFVMLLYFIRCMFSLLLSRLCLVEAMVIAWRVVVCVANCFVLFVQELFSVLVNHVCLHFAVSFSISNFLAFYKRSVQWNRRKHNLFFSSCRPYKV